MLLFAVLFDWFSTLFGKDEEKDQNCLGRYIL